MSRFKIALVLIFLLSAISFFANIWGISIYSLDEAKNSVCAREMLERNDFIVPTFNYELRTDKPPMHYYFMIFAYKLFGFNEFSARFFSAVFGILTVIATFLFARRYYNLKVAIFSAIVLIASLHLSIQFHMAVPDPYLIFFINASLFSFYIFHKEKKQTFLWLFYIFMAFGVLTKGPVAVVLPSFIVLLFLAYKHELKEIFKLKIIQGIILILAISLPWYIAVGLKTDWIWIKEFIFKHNIHRFSDSMEGHGGIFLITFLYVFLGLLPFSVFILQAISKAWKEKFKDINIFLLIFASVYIIFFAISKTKLPNYTVPSYPPLAILIGSFLLSSVYRKNLKISLLIYIFLTILLALLSYFGLKTEVEDLAYLGFSFLFLTIAGLLALFFIKKDLIKSYLVLFSFSYAFVLAFFYLIYPPIDKQNPVMQLLPLIEDKSKVYYYKSFNPAFAFYIKTPIKPIKQIKKGNYYIITRKKYLKELSKYKNLKVLGIKKDLFEKRYSVLIKAN
ncbi:ArnT family glycosyltransferase [Hydrogenothermus marinus]|uniref:4-amino-4-deoxy-L-arabinose transferase-like glycosyltransferase n=1 Tax=Hydrogenothermus marinus TaxID=133270 RepID=A0A3M0BK14_9AQUI|nr:glycosyltransferase family 39 protein [Hydrogenothermus marinus]RMA97551.1 4-amino-4-deoxy-L-arabinose transferase-like glycosyltransferase [Hydrogenothermus marinus]